MKRRNHGSEYFVFPGGSIELNESSFEAAIREVKEETSINSSIIKLAYTFQLSSGDLHYFYLAQYLSGKPELGKSKYGK